MAQSRLEKIGTIYTRTQSLLRGGAMKAEDQPLWYPIYEAFPPKVEPRYGRPAPKIPIRQIFYEEDIIRAKFQKEHRKFLGANLTDSKTKSFTQKFISIYQDFEKTGVPAEEIYEKAVEAFFEQSGIPENQRIKSTETHRTTREKKEPLKINLENMFHD